MPNGVVALCIGHLIDGVCHIELWLMSCRVLKRDMECAMLDELVEKCRNIGISELRGYYYPTAKNAMVKDFYGNMGFSRISENVEESIWSLSINNQYTNKNKHIQVRVEQ